MINAQDLRKGNILTWVDDESDTSYLVVEGFIGDDLWVTMRLGDTTESQDVSFDSVRPIELTPEILEKCGFEKINHRIDGIIYKKDWLKFLSTLNCEWRGGYIGSDIKYLHQLQNLFYSLTGKEIEVNL